MKSKKHRIKDILIWIFIEADSRMQIKENNKDLLILHIVAVTQLLLWFEAWNGILRCFSQFNSVKVGVKEESASNTSAESMSLSDDSRSYAQEAGLGRISSW